MKDLISRKAAIAALRRKLDINAKGEIGGFYNTIIRNNIECIELLRPADAVPVVRCKDCKHWGMHKRLNVPWCYEMHIDKSEDGFCDSGERREE